MLLNLLAIVFIVGVIYVLAKFVVAPLLGLSLAFSILFVVALLALLLLVFLLLEIVVRRVQSKTLSQKTGVGADLTFATYYQYYFGKLRPGMTPLEVRAQLDGFANVQEVRRANQLIELYTYRFGIIGRPLLEIWYDAAGRFDHIEEGR